jgi:hypothetical protein
MDEKIQELAYYKWLNAGSPEGRDLEFWLEAEDEFFSDENQWLPAEDLLKELEFMNEFIDEMFLSTGIIKRDDDVCDPVVAERYYQGVIPASTDVVTFAVAPARAKQFNEEEEEKEKRISSS